MENTMADKKKKTNEELAAEGRIVDARSPAAGDALVTGGLVQPDFENPVTQAMADDIPGAGVRKVGDPIEVSHLADPDVDDSRDGDLCDFHTENPDTLTGCVDEDCRAERRRRARRG